MVLPYVCEYLHIVSDIGMEKLNIPNSEDMFLHFKDINHLLMYFGSTLNLQTFTRAIFKEF